MGIYRLYNIHSGYAYIGGTIDSIQRKSSHKMRLRLGIHKSKQLQEMWNSYSPEDFKFEIIEHVSDRSILLEREQHWLSVYPLLLNSSPTAGSPKGVVHHEKSRKAMSEAHIHSENIPNRKPILQLSIDGLLIKEWPSIQAASRSLGVSRTCISLAVKNGNQSIKSIWKLKILQ